MREDSENQSAVVCVEREEKQAYPLSVTSVLCSYWMGAHN